MFKIKFTNIDHFKEGIKNQIFANIDYYYLYTLYELEIKLHILFHNNYILYTIQVIKKIIKMIKYQRC